MTGNGASGAAAAFNRGDDTRYDRILVRGLLDQAKAAGRRALTAPESKVICEAYGIAVPREAVAADAADAARLATSMGYPAVMKIVSPQILHDVEVEEAAEFLYQHGIPAYAYSTEIPVAVLGAKYRWARGAGLIPNF